MPASSRRSPAPAPLPVAPDEVGLFQGIVEHLGGVVLVCDGQGAVHWASSRAGEWLGAAAAPAGDAALAPLPGLRALALPWTIGPEELAHVCAGETLRLRPDTLRGADGVVRRCHARLSPLPRSHGASLVLAWIDEQVEDEGASLSDTQRRRALASAHVGSWSRSFVDGSARVDPLWCYPLGLDPCEGPDHLERWARRIHPDDVERFRRAGAALAAAGTDAPEFDVEYRILTADSRWLWVLQRGRVSRRDPQRGVPLEAAGICIDIDARKRAEVEVHENESRLATALWGAQAAFWQLHVPSDTTTRSPLWFAMTGYSREQWDSLPQPWASRLHPEDRPGIERLVAEHLEGRSQSLELRYRMRCADGSWKWMMDRGRVVEWDFDGRPIAVIGVSIDIDQQTRTELAAEDSRKRLELALEGAQGCLWEWDIGRGRYNDAYYELLGVDPAQGRQQRSFWIDRAHPDDRERVLASAREIVEGRLESFATQYRVRHADGSWRWIVDRFRAAARDESGRATTMMGFAIDVTENVRVREALEASESGLRAITQSAPDAMFLLDRELNIRFVNHGLRGESMDELVGAHALARIDPAHRGPILECYERVLRTGEPAQFDRRIRIPSYGGDEVHMLNRVTAVRDAQGAITGLAVVVTDVTAQRRAEAELQRSERTLRTVTANTSDWLLLLDRERRVRFVNRQVRGHASESLIGRDALELVQPDQVEALRDAIERVLESGEPRLVTQRLQTTDPRGPRRLEVWVTAAQEGEQIVGTVLTCIDVTERSRRQQALVAQARILETMREAVLLVDRDDVAKLANPAFEELACRPRTELIGQPLTGLLRESVAAYPQITAAAVEHWRHNPPHVPMRREFDWRRPDGRVRRVMGAFTRVDVDGAPHVLCVYNDLTDQRDVERRILDVVQQTQRRIGADLHDGLGQELAGVAMLLRSLQSATEDGRPASGGQLAEVVAHVNRSIETARTMARGLAPVDPEHGGLAGALQRLVEAATRQSGVQVELRHQLPSSVSFSPEESTHLLRIAQEAVSNALRHAEPRTIVVSLSHEGGFATLAVRDDGRGFPDSHDSRRGLGLKTMRFRASVLHGDLQIQRNDALAGQGSGITLICRVPVHSGRPAGHAATQDLPRT
jgi:PAS domain S-box-containing protein